MFMFPEPNPKDYRLRWVCLNSNSSELFTPDAFPRCTQANFGLYSYPLKNTSNEYDVKKMKSIILDKWTNDEKAWWIGKPGEDAQMMFDMHMRAKDHQEIDPRFKAKGSIFPRSYQYEQDCVEARRQERLLLKVLKDDEERLRDKQKVCICPDEDNEVKKEIDKLSHEYPRWQKPPELFAESQHDPCKRRAEFQKFGQTFQTEACRFYYDNYPPPPPSKHVQKFVK